MVCTINTLVTIEGQIQLGSTLTASYYNYFGDLLNYKSIKWVGLTKSPNNESAWKSASILSTNSTLRITNQTPYLIRCIVDNGLELVYSNIITVVGNLKSSQNLNSIASSLDIIGKGLDFKTPINRLSRSSNLASDIGRINQSLYIILTTVKGSIPMLPQLGSELASMIFSLQDPDDLTSVEVSIREDITTQEPRITISDLVLEFLPDDYLLKVSLSYVITNTNITSNFIYTKTLVEGDV